MKRAVLIGGGTVVGVAAVLSYAPPNLGSSSLGPLPVSGGNASGTSTTQTPVAPTPTQAAAKVPVPAATTKKTHKTKKAKTAAKTTALPPAATATAPATTGTQTVTGRGYSAGGYGIVKVRITVVGGIITSVDAVSYPNGDPRSQDISRQAIPWLKQQTLAVKNNANINGVGGATYTTNAWIGSLQSALTAAGL